MKLSYWCFTLLLSLLLTIGSSQESFSVVDAVQHALAHHPDLIDADLDAQNARLQYRETLAIGIPNVSANADYAYAYQLPFAPLPDFIGARTYQILGGEDILTDARVEEAINGLDPINFAFQQPHTLNVGVRAEFLLFDGNFLQGLKAAKMFISLADKQRQLTEQEIVQNVVRAYHNVLISHENRAIIDDNISNVSQALVETKAFYDNGFVEELDVDRLQQSLANLNYERQKINELIAVNKNVLKYQMAFPLEKEVTLTDSLSDLVDLILIENQAQIDSIDFTQRPEHRLIAESILLDHQDLNRIKQGYMPRVTGSISYGQNLQRRDLFDGDETGFLPVGSVGIRAEIPIYDGGRTKALVDQKKIAIDKKERSLREFDRAMQLQVLNAARSFESAKLAYQSATKSLALNQKIYDKTKIKYQEGVGSSIEVTQAESNLYNAQANYIKSLYDILINKTELDMATGEILELANK